MIAPQRPQQHIGPVSILKNNTVNTRSGPSDTTKLTHHALSEDEENEPASENVAKYFSDGDDEDIVPISGQALELLQSEKAVKAGYLLKKGEKRRSWKRRWFVLRSTKLAMYKDNKEYKLLRIIDMNEIHSVVHVTCNHKYKYMFAISTPRRMYYFQADTQDTMNDWIRSLEMTKADHMRKTDDEDDNDNDRAGDVRNNHVAFAILPSQQEQPISQRRRSSNAPVSPPFLERRSSIVSGGTSVTSSDCAREHVLSPIEIPKVTPVTNHLAAYSPSRIYPLSPTTDHQHFNLDGLASSDDDEDDDDDNGDLDKNSNSYESRQIQQEENRNRVLMEGYLLKLGRNKGWRKRWFVLRTDTLVYYEDDKEYAPHRIIPLVNILDSLEIDPVSRSKQFCFKIVIPKRSYVLCADSEIALESWLNALSVAIRRAKRSDVEHNQTRQETPSLERITTGTSSMLENTSHISSISGAGAIGGAGGALPGRAHTHRHMVRGS